MPLQTQQPSLVIKYALVLSGLFPNRDGGSGEQGVGHIRMFGFNFAPGGTANPDGQLLPLSQNTALFSILGTNYGGDGSVTFALPNLAGRAAQSSGQGPGLSDYFLGQESGLDSITIESFQVPVSDGGGSGPTSTIEESLTINYAINPYGVFPGGSGTPLGFTGQITAFAGNFAPNGTLLCEGQLLPISEYDTLFSVIGTTYGGDGETTFALPDLRGRVPVGTGTGPGLANITLGESFGVEDLTLTQANLPVEMGGSGQPVGNHGPSLGITYLVALQGVFPSSSGGTLPGGVGDPAVLGEIVMFAGTTPPTGYVVAAGQLLPINQNQALFSLFGTTYGGDGRVNFALPDLRGRAAIDDGAGANLGERLGSSTSVLTPDDFDALTLTDTVGVNALWGANQSDSLSGLSGDDILTGLAGDDVLIGGSGSNQLLGGGGSDTADFRDATAGVTASLITGSASANGFGGSDTFTSIENLAGSGQVDSLTGDGGGNSIYGRGGNDMLFGGAGDDVVDGGTGVDAMDGGDGSDIFFVDDIGDIVIEAANQGIDLVRSTVAAYTLSANVENLAYIGNGAFTGTGNGLDNALTGGTGNDVLDGGSGNDSMAGGAGNDIYLVDAAGDIVSEAGGSGIDRVETSTSSFTLPTDVENLEYIGSGAFSGTGNGGANIITGGGQGDTLSGGGGDDTLGGEAGNDVLDGGDGSDRLTGGTGADTMNGGAGNDILVVDDAGDVANGGDGIDTVQIVSAASYTISSTVENVSNLSGGAVSVTLNDLANTYGGGAAADTAFGQAGDDMLYGRGGDDLLLGGDNADRLFGDAGQDSLNGQAGNDMLYGGADTDQLVGGSGNDTLYGEAGSDSIDGGSGIDQLYGGAGGDVFTFNNGDSGATVATADIIRDYSRAQGDFISLQRIDAIAGGANDAFSFIGTAAFSNVAGQLRYEVVGGETRVLGDIDGNGVADVVIRIIGVHTLTTADFTL